MALLKLKATKPFRYASRALAVGDQFEATSRDARLLTAIRKAEYVRAEANVSPPPARVAAKARAAMEPAKPAEDTKAQGHGYFVGDKPKTADTSDQDKTLDIAAEDLKTARAEYREKMGKMPGPQWDVATIRQRMADAADADGEKSEDSQKSE